MPGLADIYTDKMVPRLGYWLLAIALNGLFVLFGTTAIVGGEAYGWVGVGAGLGVFALWTAASFGLGLQEICMGSVYFRVAYPMSMGLDFPEYRFKVQEIVGAYRGDAGRNRGRYKGLIRWGRRRVVVVLKTGEKVTLGTRNPEKVVELIQQLYVKKGSAAPPKGRANATQG